MTQYTTGELAKLCGTTVRTVQFYDSKDLLKPSALTDGGRRLYSEDDLKRFRLICFLKDFGFSLKDIATLLEDDAPQSMLLFLVESQEQCLMQQIEQDSARLEGIKELKRDLRQMNDTNFQTLEVIATIMGSRKKLKRMHIWMLMVGLLMDVAWIGGLIYGIASGVWWPFAAGLVFAIAAGVFVSWLYYSHIAYICPEDHTVFRAPLKMTLFAAHTPKNGEMRKLTCPTCGYKGYCLGVYVPDSKPIHQGKYLIWPQE